MSQGWGQSFNSNGKFTNDQNSALSFNKGDSKIATRDRSSCLGGEAAGSAGGQPSTQSFSSWGWSSTSSQAGEMQPINSSSSDSQRAAVGGMGTWRRDDTKEDTKSPEINWDHIVEDEFRKEIAKMALEVAEEQNRM